MQTIPNSTLYLCKNVDLDPNYNYTIDFDNITAQANYFDGKIATEFEINEGYSYIRDSQTLKVQANIDDLLGINYLFYNNGSKRYYAFITKKEYINPTCTSLTFKLDVLQSFMFNYEIDESFVEREHQDRYIRSGTTLTPIYNRETENIEKGQEYIKTSRTKISDNIPANFTLATGGSADKTFQLYWLTIVCKESIGKKSWSTAGDLITGSQPSETRTTSVKGMPNNVFTYVAPLALKLGTWANPPVIRCTSKAGVTSSSGIVPVLTLNQVMNLTQDPKVISINIGRYCPFSYGCDKDTEQQGEVYTATRYKLYPNTAPEGSWTNDINLTCYEWNSSNNTGSGAMFFIDSPNGRSAPILTTTHNLQINLADLSIENVKNIAYEPKLNTNDYSYYEVELGSQKLKLNKEDLPVDTLQLEFNCSYSVKNGRAIIPLNYKGQDRNLNDMLAYDSTTNEMALRTDAWLSYLANNKASMISGFITGAIQTGAGLAIGLATGGIGLAVAGTQVLNYAGGIANSIAQINDLKNKPDEVKKTALDLVLDYTTKDLYITLNNYDIRPQFKSKVFNYFYHYGYKCNDFKKPNTRSRYYFNYIKTIGANIKTEIDADFRAEIENAYNNGITIWHYRNATTFKGVNNYDYENVELNLMED